jgi:hypothetical protein
MKFFWIPGLFFALLFSVLLSIRLDLLNRLFPEPENTGNTHFPALADKDSWMNIYQNNRKIGFSHTILSKTENAYRLEEVVFMRINTLGMIHNINLRTAGVLNTDFTLASFDFEMKSGRFRFDIKGTFSDDTLSVTTQSAGVKRSFDIDIKQRPYLATGMIQAASASGLNLGDEFTYPMFDPATMGQEPVRIKVVGQENISVLGVSKPAKIVSMRFKGITQKAWIDPEGEVLKEESLLGIRLEKTNRTQALSGIPVESSEDLTKVVSVPSNIIIEDPESLNRLVVEISGVPYDAVDLEGGRQTLREHVLFVQKESISNLPFIVDVNRLRETEKKLLKPSPFIQSDHEKIKSIARIIVSGENSSLAQVKKLVSWVHTNIEKRPVISLPDALSTLENKRGDCNEHAVLFAALARAAGFPAAVETGLVYLDGRFYYHAWNVIYLGRWITVDSLFGQVPADVTHIRFSGGTPEQQLDLMNVIGKVKLKVIQKYEIPLQP